MEAKTTALPASKLQTLVTFRLGKQIYALPIDPIVQIVEMVAITPIPQVNHSVEGVVNYHGVTVPVVNTRRHLGMPPVPLGLDMHIVVAIVAKRTIGLIVDQVLQVIEVPDRQIARADDILPDELGEADILDGIIHTPEGTVLVLDLGHLFSAQQVRALAQAVSLLPQHATVDEQDQASPAESEAEEQA